jgi:hypothetical protein
MRRYDAAVGCCLAFLLMATAITSMLYLPWLIWIGAGAVWNEQHAPDGPYYAMYILEALPALLVALLWVSFFWVIRRPH